jgi:hypothetical protein
MVDKKGIGVVVILVFLGIFGAVGSGTVYEHNRAIQEYEPTEATILETDIIVDDSDDDTSYEPVVRYEYTVDGETYTSDNVFPGRFTRSKGSRSGATSVTSQYSPGDRVTIQHNPDRPQQSYLRNDGLPDSWWFAIGYAVIAALGGLWLIWKGFKRWRQRKLIRDTPTENARSLSIGPSEIKGTARAKHALSAPFSNVECVVATYEVEQYDDDDDDSGGSWDTVEEGVVHAPFIVDDGTGGVLVRPHDDATYDLDPEDEETVYVDSSERGPPPVQEFVRRHDDISFPSNAGGKENDRKYRQNLIRDGESAYVFGTVQPRDEIDAGADNADRLVIKKVTDDSMREPMFLLSDDEEQDLITRRKWALWRAPVGLIFLTVALCAVLFTVAPSLGLELPIFF